MGSETRRITLYGIGEFAILVDEQIVLDRHLRARPLLRLPALSTRREVLPCLVVEMNAAAAQLLRGLDRFLDRGVRRDGIDRQLFLRRHL